MRTLIARRWALAAVAGALILAVAAWAIWFFAIRDTDQDKITRAAVRFHSAAVRNDTAAITRDLCSAEAKTFADAVQPVGKGAAGGSGGGGHVTISRVRVVGDVASARLHFATGDRVSTLYFQRESGVWKVCAPAAAKLQ